MRSIFGAVLSRTEPCRQGEARTDSPRVKPGRLAMKVVYLVHQFYPEFYSGTEKFVLNLAGMTQQAGNKVKVITYSFYEDLSYDRRRGKILCKEFIYRGIPVLAIRHTRLPEDLYHTLENEELSEIASDLINEEHPDVVHVGHPMRISALIRALPPLGI